MRFDEVRHLATGRDAELRESVDISQFETAEAGLTCLSVLLPGVGG